MYVSQLSYIVMGFPIAQTEVMKYNQTVRVNTGVFKPVTQMAVDTSIRINAMIFIGIDRHWLALGNDRGSPDIKREKHAQNIVAVIIRKFSVLHWKHGYDE